MKSINQWTQQWAEQNKILSTFLPSTASTNNLAKNSYKQKNCIFLADEQTAGRGRGQNSWSNGTAGSSLLSTWCFTAEPPQPIFSCRLGLGLYKSFKEVWPKLSFSIKPPNDIYLDEGKLAGLLIELSQSGDRCDYFIGLGLNAFEAPQITEQKTSCLQDSTAITQKDWDLFCTTFFKQLIQLKETSSQSELNSQEQKDLLLAMEQRPNNTYIDIKADGSLKSSDNNWVSWQDL